MLESSLDQKCWNEDCNETQWNRDYPKWGEPIEHSPKAINRDEDQRGQSVNRWSVTGLFRTSCLCRFRWQHFDGHFGLGNFAGRNVTQ